MTCLYLILYSVFQKTFFPSAVVTIGFDPVTYSVLEDTGSVDVTVSILNGTLGRNVEVTLLILDGTATGKILLLNPNKKLTNVFLPLQLGPTILM